MCLFLFVLFLSSICWIESVYSSKFSEYGASGKIVSSEAGTTTFRVEVEERMFDISVIGEGIKSLAFDKEQKAIALENNGTHGTIEILIPKELLDGEFTVMTDDQQRIDFARSETATHSTLLLEKSADVEVIVIYGTTVIPEFPVFVILILFAGIIALVLTKNHMFRTG